MKSNNNSFAASCFSYGADICGILDIHSHVLPNMDDGATDVSVSLAMLSEAWSQGVRKMAATPHFYADRETPESFLERRAQAVAELIRGGYHPGTEHPLLYLGAEVAFFSGMTRSRQLSEFCIGGTRNILIEMPFERWSESVISEILDLTAATGLRPIIAHIERYWSYQRASTLGRLIEGGAIIQSNAEFFTEKKTSKKAMKLLRQGGIHILGTDAHGIAERTPNMGAGADVILQGKFGAEMLDEIAECSRFILKGATPIALPETVS